MHLLLDAGVFSLLLSVPWITDVPISKVIRNTEITIEVRIIYLCVG